MLVSLCAETIKPVMVDVGFKPTTQKKHVLLTTPFVKELVE